MNLNRSAFLVLGAIGVTALMTTFACKSPTGPFGATSSTTTGAASSSSTTGAGGSMGTSGSTGAGTGCGLDIGTNPTACQTCQAQKCCDTATSAQKKPGTWTNSASKICSENECASECGLATPTCGGITPDPPSCLMATDAKCCAEVTACGQSDQCVAIIYLCIDDQNHAPGTAAFNQCAMQYPDGLKLFNKLDACSSTVACP